MATVTHYIYSDYDEADREALERETGQHVPVTDGDSDADAWATARTFGSSSRYKPPPRFIRAVQNTSNNDLDLAQGRSSPSEVATSDSPAQNVSVSEWYRSLSRSRRTDSSASLDGAQMPGMMPVAGTSTANKNRDWGGLAKKLDAQAVLSDSHSLFSPSPSSSAQRSQAVAVRQSEAIKKGTTSNTRGESQSTRKDWFIARALQSAHDSDTARRASSAPADAPATLADILSRDPPPLAVDKALKPPVWLTIGPGNRGFDLLQRSGWKEGEALGRIASESRLGRRGGLGFQKGSDDLLEDQSAPVASSSRVYASKTYEDRGKQLRTRGKGTAIVSGDNVNAPPDIIDLTHSQSDSEGEEDGDWDWDDASGPSASGEHPAHHHHASQWDVVLESGHIHRSLPEDREVAEPGVEDVDMTSGSGLDHEPRALLTPLPTVLKSDRLGIGLKAKRAGPYKESVKRVTHSQRALAAHVRASEEMKRKKADVGRGRRGYERVQKKEANDRKRLFAYLNAD